MEWKKWEGKKVFVQLKSGGVYTGKVLEVNDEDTNMIWFSLLDKYENNVTFIHSEIIKIVEEE